MPDPNPDLKLVSKLDPDKIFLNPQHWSMKVIAAGIVSVN
jgi:hypothetical protein